MAKAVIQIYGEIGCEVNIMDVQAQIKEAGDVDSIELRIFSPGGNCLIGWAIYDYLKGLKLPIDTYNDGYCASMATVLFLLGKNRFTTEHSSNLIHYPWSIAMGNSIDFMEAVQELQKEEVRILEVYTSITGQAEAKLREIMEAGKELDAKEFKDLGFATEIIINENIQASMKAFCQNKFSLAAKRSSQDLQSIKQIKEIKNQNMSILKDLKKIMNSISGRKNMEVDTDQGTLYSESDIVKGAKVFTDEDMTVPAPNGNYECEAEGETYTVSDGEVTQVDTMESDPEEGSENKKDKKKDPEMKKDDDPEMKKGEDEEMKKALVTITATLASMKKESDETLKEVLTTLKALNEENSSLKDELKEVKKNIKSDFKPESGTRSNRIGGEPAAEKLSAFEPKGAIAKAYMTK